MQGAGGETENRGTLCKPSSYCVTGAVPVDRGLAAQLSHLVQPQLPAVDGGRLRLQGDDELLRVLRGGQACLEKGSGGWDQGSLGRATRTRTPGAATPPRKRHSHSARLGSSLHRPLQSLRSKVVGVLSPKPGTQTLQGAQENCMSPLGDAKLPGPWGLLHLGPAQPRTEKHEAKTPTF